MARPRTLTESDFEVRPSKFPGAGLGLFAKVPVRKGDTIAYYTGKILTDKQSDREPYVSSRYLLWVCKDHWIYGEGPAAGYARLINHCHDKPNAELVVSTRWKTARIRALRAIPAGQEILYDYGPDYWETLGQHPAQGKHKGQK